MERKPVIDIIKSGETRNLLKHLTTQSDSVLLDVKDVIDTTFNEKHEVAFRAAWILEHIYLFKLDDFLPQMVYFLNRFHEQNDPSAQRHFCKILTFSTDKKAPAEVQETIDHYHADQLIETLFTWLIGEVPVAVKAYCLSALANFSKKQTWIKHELLQTIDYLIDKESIAFYTRAKKVRKEISS